MLVMGPIYVGLPLGTLVWTRAEFGPAALTWLLATIAISDSAQYYSGRLLGRTKLAPAISPAKTVEGAIGGVLAAGPRGLCDRPVGRAWLVARPLCRVSLSSWPSSESPVTCSNRSSSGAPA